ESGLLLHNLTASPLKNCSVLYHICNSSVSILVNKVSVRELCKSIIPYLYKIENIFCNRGPVYPALSASDTRSLPVIDQFEKMYRHHCLPGEKLKKRFRLGVTLRHSPDLTVVCPG